MTPLILRCRACGRSQPYSRDIDPTIPACVAAIEHSACDRCDRGDFHTETWLDADGNEVAPEERT